MLERYLFNEDNKTGKIMFDAARFEIAWFDQKQFVGTSAWFGLSYLAVAVVLFAVAFYTFGFPSIPTFVVLVFLFSTRDYLGVALAVVYYGLLKMKLPTPPTPPPSVMALLLALSLFAFMALPVAAQSPYVPPSDVATPAEIGAQMTAILQWAAIKWFLAFSFAVAGMGLLLVTIKQSVR